MIVIVIVIVIDVANESGVSTLLIKWSGDSSMANLCRWNVKKPVQYYPIGKGDTKGSLKACQLLATRSPYTTRTY